MATKTSDLLGSLPTVAELLERPPVRALVDRWNRSVVAGGVRSFLDELRSDLQRRATDAGLPSIRELAERAAKYVIQMQQPSLRPAINATGRLLDPSWAGSPLADHAWSESLRWAVDMWNRVEPESCDIGHSLARLTGAEAATVVHSYSGAIWLDSVGAGGWEESGDRSTGDGRRRAGLFASWRWPRRRTVRVKEVGCANRASDRGL